MTDGGFFIEFSRVRKSEEERAMAEKGYEVRWEDRSCVLESGSTYLDVKKAFGWKNDVLMVGEGDECQGA